MGDERSDQETRRPHADSLRIAIDKGLAGDKVAFPDPAAVPLGADDEAGGAAPSAENVRTAMQAEIGSRTQRERPFMGAFYGMVAVIALIAASFIAWGYVLTR